MSPKNFSDIIDYCFNTHEYRLCICRNVYVPAEDTWLAIELIDHAKTLLGTCVKRVFDIGTGTGVLALHALKRLKPREVIVIDVNPHACYCALHNFLVNNATSTASVICCDNVTCIAEQGITGSFIVYNTPYLPVKDEGILGAAWSGGLGEALRTIYSVAHLGPQCLLLILSSLSGDINSLLKYLSARGYSIITRKIHVFFEDIIGVLACRARET